MKKQLAWILGGASIVGLGMIASLNACSGDTATNDAGNKDSTTKDQAVNETSTQDQSNPETGPQDAGADCKTPSGPFTTDAGPFCPFQVGPDGGQVFSDCQNGQHCCIPSGTGASTCQNGTCTFNNPDASNSDFQCNEANDCPSNQVCCLTAPGYLQQDPGCTSYDFVSKQHGTSCAASCPTGQAQICGSTAECTGGKTCFPVNTKGMWLGACLGADGGI